MLVYNIPTGIIPLINNPTPTKPEASTLFEIKESPPFGQGAFATKAFRCVDLIYFEKPLISHHPTRKLMMPINSRKRREEEPIEP